MIRAWLLKPANRAEIAKLRGVIDPMTIKRQSPQHVHRLNELARQVATAFCALLTSSTVHPRRSTHAGHR